MKFWGIPFVVVFPKSKIKIGDNVRIRTSFKSNLIGISRRSIIATHSKTASILIGSYCGISGVTIGAMSSISIGNKVLIGANVLITDFDWHPVDPILRHTGESKTKPIVIEDNVFIGYSSTILKGVTIGQNSVIGANSVVTSDIPANCIAGGNPCRIIANLKV